MKVSVSMSQRIGTNSKRNMSQQQTEHEDVLHPHSLGGEHMGTWYDMVAYGIIWLHCMYTYVYSCAGLDGYIWIHAHVYIHDTCMYTYIYIYTYVYKHDT